MKYLVELAETDGSTERQISFSFEAEGDPSAAQLSEIALDLYDEGDTLDNFWTSAPGGSFAVETRIRGLWRSDGMRLVG